MSGMGEPRSAVGQAVREKSVSDGETIRLVDCWVQFKVERWELPLVEVRESLP